MSKEINVDQLMKDYSYKQIGEIFSVRISGKVEKLGMLKEELKRAMESIDEKENKNDKKLSISAKIGIQMYNKAKFSLENSFNQKMQKLHSFSQNNNVKEIIEDYEKADDKFAGFCESIQNNVGECEKNINKYDDRVTRAMFEYNIYSIDRAIEQFDFHKQFFNDLANEDEYSLDNWKVN